MVAKKLTYKDEIKIWIHFNKDLLGILLTIVIFILLYFFVSENKKPRKIDLKTYTGEVELINITYKKEYKKLFYGARLDRIVFETEYFYKSEKYTSKVTDYWEYLPYDLKKIIENNEVEKLIVRCKKESPQKAMVFMSG